MYRIAQDAPYLPEEMGLGYGITAPADHTSLNCVREYHWKTKAGEEYASIEKYEDGYFEVVNLVHGQTVLYTKSWNQAKARVDEIHQMYKARVHESTTSTPSMGLL